ncbi:MAG: FHA domain-containing protein [Deltaproteobacteria bacterium]|nr:FHA domain-containing protein [Deltaproteobacteria bacterium]
MDDEDRFPWTEQTVTTETDVHPDDSVAERPPALLEQIEGPGSPCRIKLDRGMMVFGRSANSTVQLPSSEVSRTHLLIKRDGAEFVCQDLNSYNGTFLNGVKVHSAVLRPGDTIQIGNIVFVFRDRI